jgi:hypothetical protein
VVSRSDAVFFGGGNTREYAKRFGDPVPRLFTTFGVADPVIAACTCPGVAFVWVLRYAAAMPATCGDAIDVPVMISLAVSLRCPAETTLVPGAKTSTHEPYVAYRVSRASDVVVADTVMTPLMCAGV